MKHTAVAAVCLTVASTALSSCSGVKNCAEPQLNLPSALEGNSTDSVTMADMKWWQVYTDSSLVAIIDETLRNNRDLLAAAAKVEEMRALYGVSKANFLPTLSAIASADNETNDYYDKKSTSDPEFSLKATLSWEADLWGGLSWARKKRCGTVFCFGGEPASDADDPRGRGGVGLFQADSA